MKCTARSSTSYNEVLQYFDGRMIGLTATPASYIDRDTFLAFDCHDGKPTYLYTYEQAVKDKYLVDYNLYAARTSSRREGIHGRQLERRRAQPPDPAGLDPDEINYEGTELEKKVTNRDTLRRQWEEIMEVCHQGRFRAISGQDHRLCHDPGTCPAAGRSLQRDVPAVPGHGAGDHVQIQLPGYLSESLQEKRPAAHRHFGGHAGYGRGHPGSGQPGLHEAGAIADQATADDRARHAQAGGLPPVLLDLLPNFE